MRDPRIDVFRGIALLVIFIDHVPGNLWSYFTPRNFGLSDAAEGFVLLSGMSAGLAYSRHFRRPARVMVGLGRVWGRMWTLYLVHILVTMSALAIAAGLALFAGRTGGFTINQVDVVMDEPVQFLFRMPLLAFHLDYGDILPLYIALLLVTPFALWLACRAPWLLMAASVGLWFVAGEFTINLPNFPHDVGWFFNPLAWQLIFVAGLITGVAADEGTRRVPVWLWLQIATGAFLAFALAWTQIDALGDRMYGLLWQAGQDGWPHYLISLDKTWLPLPRIIHALALAYLLSSFVWVSWLCRTRAMAPFALLGQQALPVFALGSVIVYLLQDLRVGTEVDVLRDTVMIGCGIAAMFALAVVRATWPKA
jgi:hypothetical protein